MDNLKLKGDLLIILRDSSGRVKLRRHLNNLIVTAGKNYLAAWLQADSQAGKFMSYIGIGSNNTAAAITDTALGTELARKVGTLTNAGNVWTNTVTLNAGEGTGNVYEMALLSAAAAGTMFSRVVVGLITKAAGDSLQVTWNITIG